MAVERCTAQVCTDTVLLVNCSAQCARMSHLSENIFANRARERAVALCSTPFQVGPTSQKTFRYLWRFYSLLFRGPLPSRKTVFGPFSLLFRGFFVALSWPPFWANFTRTRPGTVF